MISACPVVWKGGKDQVGHTRRVFSDHDQAEARDFHERYREYNKALRTWFVGFGIGGPVLLLTNDTVLSRLVSGGWFRAVSLLFISGAGAQIIIAFVNKMTTWYGYYASMDAIFAKTKTGQFWIRIDKQFWMDIVCDLFSMIAFAGAIIILLLCYRYGA
jgi:hypothetical protein